MLVITVSKEDYQKNEVIKNNPFFMGLHLRPKDAKSISEIDFNGEVRYRLEFDNVEFTPPKDFKFGTQKEVKQILQNKDENK